jgi:hypothetical protein
VRDPKQIHDLNKDLNLTPLQKRLKAKALSMRKPDSSAPRPYDNDPIPACPAENVKPGIIWKAYQADLPWIAGVPALKPYVTGTATHAGGNSIEAAKNGVLVFEGYFRIPQDGSYTFYLTSGSNAFLRLHDAAVIDADYNYAAGTERAGSIRLKAGLHLFRLYYRAQKGAKVLLNLEWKTPGGLRQTIPVSAFAHGEISGGDPEPREN